MAELMLQHARRERIKDQRTLVEDKQRLNKLSTTCDSSCEEEDEQEESKESEGESSALEEALSVADRVRDDDDDLREFVRIEREIEEQEQNGNQNEDEHQHQHQHQQEDVVKKAPLAQVEDNYDSLLDDVVNCSARTSSARPLTLYLPLPDDISLDLRQHLNLLGHDIDAHPDAVSITTHSCTGKLWKRMSGASVGWRKRIFLLDRNSQLLVYFRPHNRRPSGVLRFDQIKDVYVDHARATQSRHVFAVVATSRKLILASKSAQVMRIWVDVIFSGARAHSQQEQQY